MLRLLEKSERMAMRDLWPNEVIELSIPADTFELSHDSKLWLGASSSVFSDGYSIEELDVFPPDFDEIITSIIAAKSDMHCQIGKLTWQKYFPQKVTCIKSYFTYKFEQGHIGRSLYLHDSIAQGYSAYCYLNSASNFPSWSEFRLFIRDRKVIGVSQYHHLDTYPEIHENLAAIKASMIPFSGKLIEALHMDTVVADVFVEQQDDGSFTTTLIELNPFIWRTDPCLYSWKNGGDFDGGIRYCKSSHNSYRNTNTSGQHASQMDVFREEDYRRS